MFEHLEAEAYHKLRREVHEIVNEEMKEPKIYDEYYSGKMRAFAEVLKCMISIDNELHEKIMRESEKTAAYYEAERADDESSHEQQ